MLFGVFDHLDFSGAPLAEHFEHRLRLAEVYDRCGFHGYHVAEHHATPLGAAPSPSVFLAAVAQRTKRLRIGPLVYVLPLYNPLRLIEEVGMLDNLSGGRFMLGVGRGASPIEARFCGIDEAEMTPRYQEALACLLQGLREQRLTFHGAFYRVDDAPMLLKPVQRPHPPLWYGLGRPESVAWAAANDVNVVMLALDNDVRALADLDRAEWARLMKPADAIPLLGVCRAVVVADTDEAAAALARDAYAKWAMSFEWLWRDQGVIIRERFPGLARTYPEAWDELAALGAGCAGSPDTVRRFVLAAAENTGCNYFVARFAFGSLTAPQAARSAELFAEHVMSAFPG
jgi:alkanesulfonate monooxygenase SsuD/methylene tetrahydromethanopterin reductase-like flavin-dependent oxidoreductase (luciferase family)